MDSRSLAPEDGYEAELVDARDPEIGHELIRVRFADGRLQELRLHDYDRLYAIPGLYERIVHERLGCRSPAMLAAMLAAAVDALGRRRADARVIDIAAGNGVSGEALAAVGLRPVLGTDIVPAARAAALRDRPGVYQDYRTLDLLALSEAERAQIAALHADVLSCVAPVGERRSELPAAALAQTAALLAPDALVGYLHDPAGGPDRVGERLPPVATELARRRYVHRRTVTGRPFELEAVVWRLRRG